MIVPDEIPVRPVPAEDGPVGRGLDLAMGLAYLAAGPARKVGRWALHPPLVPDALSPARAVRDVTVRAQRAGEVSAEAAADLLSTTFERLDLVAIVDAVLDRIDLTDLVRSRVDLARLASEVIDEIDLPAIIRESSSGVASDVVTGARAGAATADEAVARFLSRRRGRRNRIMPGEQPT